MKHRKLCKKNLYPKVSLRMWFITHLNTFAHVWACARAIARLSWKSLYNSLRLSFTNIQCLCSNFVDCESFLESNCPDILALYEKNLDTLFYEASFSWGCSVSLYIYLPYTHIMNNVVMAGLVCVCLCVCVFPSTVEASPDWNKTINAMPEIRPAMLCWGNHFVSSTFITIS